MSIRTVSPPQLCAASSFPHGGATLSSLGGISVEDVERAFKYDPENGCLFWKEPGRGRVVGARAGSRATNGYIRISLNGFRCPEHWLVWLLFNHELPASQIDHINRVKHDNRIENLRLATQGQQNINKVVPKNRSGFRGVVPTKSKTKKWAASIQVNKKFIWLGSFEDKEQAAAAYRAAARKYFGEFAID